MKLANSVDTYYTTFVVDFMQNGWLIEVFI